MPPPAPAPAPALAPPLDLIIRPTPPSSPLCNALTSALQQECATLYPDYCDFPFIGEGDWLNGHSAEIIKVDDTMAFWIAFAVDGEDRDCEGVVGDMGMDMGVPVGCVGVRMLPFFPLHRAVDTDTDTDTAMVADAGQPGVLLESKSECESEPPTAEVKRMYVDQLYRGRRHVNLCTVTGSDDSNSSKHHQHNHNLGSATTPTREIHPSTSIAALLLRQAETFAREHLSCRRVVLETGMRQAAAMALYKRQGWVRRAEFGDYVGAGEDVGGLSRCWEKML